MGHDRPIYGEQDRGTSGRAAASLVLGLLSFCVPLILSIPAIILGFLGVADARRGKSGTAMAVIGIIAGFASMLTGLVFAAIVGAVFGVQYVREAAARNESAHNMRQIVLAMHSYNDAHKKLPQYAIYSKEGRPLLSWRVEILPYVEEIGLYQTFRRDEPWDSPHNMQFVKMMPKVFAHPLDPKSAAEGKTYYQVFVGDPQERPQPVFLRDASAHMSLPKLIAQDGTPNTIAVVEASEPVIWTKPEDISYSAKLPIPKLGLYGGPFNVVLWDVSARTFRQNQLTETTLRCAITVDDGMVLGPDW